MEPIFLLKGLIIGFAMAVPIGPVSVMCIRKTLAEGHSRGLITQRLLKAAMTGDTQPDDSSNWPPLPSNAPAH